MAIKQRDINRGLSPANHALLKRIIKHTGRRSNRLFDKRDNCLQKSNRFIAERLIVSPSRIDRLIRECKQKDLIRVVVDNFGVTRLMLDPRFLWYWDIRAKPLAVFMFLLRDYNKGWEHRLYCTRKRCMIDPETGEDFGYYDWGRVAVYAHSYCMYDVNYRRPEEKSPP